MADSNNNSSENNKNGIISYIKTLVAGGLIGIANVIPGVSGGTFALVLGIYDRFIGAFNDLGRWFISLVAFLFGFKKEKRQRHREITKSIDWLWILFLFIGIISAIIVTSGGVKYLLENYPAQTYGLFFGLILASVVVPWSKMERKGIPELIAFVIAFALLFWFSGIEFQADYNEVEYKVYKSEQLITIKWEQSKTPSEYHIFRTDKNTDNIDEYFLRKITKGEQYTDKEVDTSKIDEYRYIVKSVSVSPVFWYVFLASALSAAAMVLPGLSGSFILLLMGVYGYIFGSFSALFTDFTASIGPLMLYGVGIVVGLLSFSKFLKWLLNKHHSITMAFLIGLMLGSLRVIYPFLDTKNAISGMDADEIPKLYFWNMPDNVKLGEYLTSMEFISIIVSFVIGIALVLILHFATTGKNKSK